MIKTLFHQIGAYKKDSILTPIYAAAEVIMEILIPFVTAAIIDEGIQAGNMQKVLRFVHDTKSPFFVSFKNFWLIL